MVVVEMVNNVNSNIGGGGASRRRWLGWWFQENTQKLFPGSSVIVGKPHFSSFDRELLAKSRSQGLQTPLPTRKGANCDVEANYREQEYVRQQGLAESIFRDMRIGFGKWPMEIENPFLNNEGRVHLCHGDEDGLVPVSLQRYIVNKLQWIQYHELHGVGNLVPNYSGIKEAILKSLLLEEEYS
ncbi:hypothetical protein R6Q57_019643 [Mikania cordata]